MNVFLLPALAADGSPVLVRDPITKIPLDPNGEWKPRSTFWQRRLRDNDVVEGSPAIPAADDGQTREANLGTTEGPVPGHTAPPVGEPPPAAPHAPDSAADAQAAPARRRRS